MNMAGGGGDSGSTFSARSTDFQAFLPRRSLKDDADFDITAMIDLVFMMNIFFLVTSLTKSAAEVDLPKAKYCTAADEAQSVVILIRSGNDPDTPSVSIQGGDGERQLSPDDLESQIRSAVEAGVDLNKKKVLIKAEAKVLVGNIVRVTSLATSVEGVEPLFAVVELDQKGK
jgi:biopolymer transport protein ExbD